MRRSLVCGLALALATVWVPAQAAVPVVVIDGKGFGHGVGMAQEGAFSMASAGATTEQIFGQFYPGAGIGRGRGPVRVPLLDAGAAPSSAVVNLPEGGEIREVGTGPASPGFPVQVPPGGSVRLSFDGARYRVVGGGGGTAAPTRSRCPSGRHNGNLSGCSTTARATPTTALIGYTHGQVPTLPPPPTTTTPTPEPPTTAPPSTEATSTTTTTMARPSTTTSAPPSGPDPSPGPAPAPDPGSPAGPSSTRTLAAIPSEGGTVALPDRQRRYRGYVEATAATGTLRLVNAVDVETYLKGMGEVRDPTWPAAALQAQAVAARTYALRAMAAGGEVCDTQRCQVYLGAQAEYAAMNKAVDDSREKVLVFDRALISAVYSANGGGFSASREEGFGVLDDSAPYLRAAPYPTKDPGAWSVTVALSDVAARLGYAGEVTGVRVARAGPSGRALEVVLDGSAGPKSVTGLVFDAALGLRSTLFTLRIETGEAPPPPPAADVALQAPPEEAAALAATETAGATTTVAPRPDATLGSNGGRTAERTRQELLVVAGWLLTAVLGAAVVVTRKRPAPEGADLSTTDVGGT